MVPATATQKIVESIFHSRLTAPSTCSTLYGTNTSGMQRAIHRIVNSTQGLWIYIIYTYNDSHYN